jgi:hypothetical protein
MTHHHPETPVQPGQVPLLDLDADEADLVLYDQLYQATAQVAGPLLLAQLARLTADSASRLQVDEARQLQQFLAQPDPDDGGGMQHPHADWPDDAAWSEVSAGLAAFIHAGAKDAHSVNDALAAELAHELAASLWSALLDHALPHAQGDGRLDIRHLVPERPKAAPLSPWLAQLTQDLRQFGLSADDIVLTAQRGLMHWLSTASRAGRLTLPMRLWLDSAEAASFLQAELAQALRPGARADVSRPTMAQEFTTLATSQLDSM